MSYLETLKPILEEAGKLAIDLRAKGLITKEKSDGTLVTNADEEISDFLTKKILFAYPKTKVISEEHPDLAGVNHPLTWAIDPIDGTKKYVAGRELWSIMVALFDTKPVFSIIYYPEGPVWYYAEKGKGAFIINEGITEKLKLPSPAKPLRIMHAPDTVDGIGEKSSYGFMKHIRRIIWGKLDVYIRTELGYWDLVPPMLIAQEAGAVLLDFNGKELILDKEDAIQRNFFVANAQCKEEILELLRNKYN